MTARRKDSRAPPTTSCVLVGGASLVGRGAGPITTMPALLAVGLASSSFFMASCSAVRIFSSSVRACTLSTVLPGSAALARSVMRRLASATFCRSASELVAASVSVLLPEIRAAKVTNSLAIWSESRCARSGVSAVPEMLMMFPSAALALTRFRRSLPLTPFQPSAAAVRSTTAELVAICAWVSSSRSSHCPGSRTGADAV